MTIRWPAATLSRRLSNMQEALAEIAARQDGFRRCRRQIAWLQEDLRRYSEIEDRGEFFKALGRIAVQQRIMQRLKSGEVDEGMKR